MYDIYVLKNTLGEIKYVGQSQNIKVRKTEHKRKKPSHTLEIIETFNNAIDAKEAEIFYIQKYNTYKNGWNKSPGGEGFEEYNRKGVGGVKKGNIPWNKGVKKCFSEKTIEQMKTNRKGRVFSRKVTDQQIKEIRNLYNQNLNLPDVGKIMKNGKKLSYLQAFCKTYAKNYNLSVQGLIRIIKHECWINV